MVRAGERFYTSIGFDPLPKTFFERSLFVRPKDREVVCHASAWDLDLEADVRIKMCIKPTAEDFTVIHHELGHVYYFLGYGKQIRRKHIGMFWTLMAGVAPPAVLTSYADHVFHALSSVPPRVVTGVPPAPMRPEPSST